MRYAWLILFLSACMRPIGPVVDIDPALQGLVDEFVGESASQGRPVSITNLIVHFSGQLDSWVPGECIEYGGDAPNTVLINAQDFNNESVAYNRIVMFHELSHCVLGREHVYTGNIVNGYCIATSIMYPDIVEPLNMYYENWAWYMQELFVGAPTAPPCSFNGYWGGI